MLTKIDQPPAHISEDEHTQLTASTPASFADIPPVLRWGDVGEVEVGGEGWWDGRVAGRIYVTELYVLWAPAPECSRVRGIKGIQLIRYVESSLSSPPLANRASHSHISPSPSML
jgi:hypothetical protein